METVGAYEAKTHLSSLLDRVMRGEHITITKHGVPVAVLSPPESSKKRNPGAAITALRRFRKSRILGDTSIRELIEEGRK